LRGRALLVHPGIGCIVADWCQRDYEAELAWINLKRSLNTVFDELEGKPAEPER
jgi:hypothetical protein